MTDFRAPDQLGEPSNRPQRLIFEHASKEASEQIKGKQTNEQARTRAIDQTGKPASKQARGRRGTPKS